jgi:lipopolysaccharide export system permease protein
MHTLHRHIFLSVLLTCAAAVGLLEFVLIAGNALKDLLAYALAGQLPPEAVARLLLLLVPYALTWALPLGTLTGVLLVLGRMAAQQEITAIRAAGLGLWYVARPVVLLGALLALLALEVNYKFMPRARTAYRQTMADMVRKNPLQFIVAKTFIRSFPDVIVYVNEKRDNEVSGVMAWKLDKEKRVTEFITARTGRVEYDEKANTLRLTLSGNVLDDHRDPKYPESFTGEKYFPGGDKFFFEPWNLDAIFGPQGSTQTKATWMTLDQLLAERHRLELLPTPVDPVETREREKERMQVSVSLNEKGANALSVLVFALIAVPLGIRVSRKETTANLAVAVALALAYYVMTESVHWLDKYPARRPDLVLWAPPLLFLLLGAWLFRRAGRV